MGYKVEFRGLHGWVVYSLVGLLLALMAHRKGLPLTIKSCFFPLIGDRIFGWIGDLVDVLRWFTNSFTPDRILSLSCSVIATMFGISTTLGLGTVQINQGLHLLFPAAIQVTSTSQLTIIWVVTAIATVSVITGMSLKLCL